MPEEIQKHIDEIHTTPMGIDRIKQNLGLLCPDSDVVDWCKCLITDPEAFFTLKGKNWYVTSGKAVFTINKYSMTIITAKKIKIGK